MWEKRIAISGTVFLICLGAFLLTCKSPSQPEDPGTGDTIAEEAKENPSFSADIQPIFNSSCVGGGCHNSSAAAGLILQQGQAYANLINVNSTNEPNFKRVVPNDAQNSYLVIKIEGRQNVGSRMPLGNTPLSAVRIQNIKNWINKGANQN